MKKFFIFIILFFLGYANDISYYQSLINKKQIIINPIWLYLKSFEEMKISKNGKFYIKFHTLSSSSTKINPGNICIRYFNIKESKIGTVEENKYICFTAYLSPEKRNKIVSYEDYDNYDFIFEVTPLNKHLSISQPTINKYCLDTRNFDLFSNNKFYCYNGNCYPLNKFINYLESNFPQNEKLILSLPYIKCVLDIKYHCNDDLNKILIIDNQSHKVKDIIYVMN